MGTDGGRDLNTPFRFNFNFVFHKRFFLMIAVRVSPYAACFTNRGDIF
jgi:hypothetical protein